MNGVTPPLPPPDHADIAAAAERLAGHAVTTPLLEYPALNDRLGGRILLKAETLQHTGSFKFRGAYNFISQLTPAQRARGVVAYSSGNHAQGVAAAAAMLGAPATIVMPADAPAIKLANTRGFGATVVTYDRHTESREALAGNIAGKNSATLIPPYDHPWTIAGQGTVGLEIAAQAIAIGTAPAAVLTPCGGGGLTAGIATALKTAAAGVQVYAVEPAEFDDTARSLAAGERQVNAPQARSICDALQAPEPGVLTFAINKALVAGGIAVSDDAVREAMVYAWRVLKLVVEPGGAAALAAVLSGAFDCHDKTVVIVLSGGNVDAELYGAVIGAA